MAAAAAEVGKTADDDKDSDDNIRGEEGEVGHCLKVE